MPVILIQKSVWSRKIYSLRIALQWLNEHQLDRLTGQCTAAARNAFAAAGVTDENPIVRAVNCPRMAVWINAGLKQRKRLAEPHLPSLGQTAPTA